MTKRWAFGDSDELGKMQEWLRRAGEDGLSYLGESALGEDAAIRISTMTTTRKDGGGEGLKRGKLPSRGGRVAADPDPVKPQRRRITYINKQVLPQAPSPTITSFRRISAMVADGLKLGKSVVDVGREGKRWPSSVYQSRKERDSSGQNDER